eukprot:649090-Alexandrium_andersonii.AAC.1
MLRLTARNLEAAVNTNATEGSKAKREALMARLARVPKGDAEAYKLLKGPPPQKLAFAINHVGGLTCCHDEVDHAARQAWGAIYDGNAGDLGALVDNFARRLGPWIPRAAQWQLPPLTAKQVLQGFARAGASAPGLDGWHPRELALMSLGAAELLARLLNFVESGGQWPQQLLRAKVAFLAKSSEPSMDPREFRLLMVASVVYRRWGAIRLRHAQAWIKSWASPHLFAGVPGQAADAAAWSLARAVEEATIGGRETSAMALDIWKAFDQ